MRYRGKIPRLADLNILPEVLIARKSRYTIEGTLNSSASAVLAQGERTTLFMESGGTSI